MREERIIIYPFEYLELLTLKGVKQVNEHAWVSFSGQIPFEKRQECMELVAKQTWVQIVAISGKQECSLFYGIIDNLVLKVENQTCIIEVMLKSGSSLMDKKEHIRSFQDENLNYDQLLQVCGADYLSYDHIMTVGKRKIIEQFIMQYQETDWQFIKRLASKLQIVVVPEYRTMGVKYYFGLPNRDDRIVENTCEYTVVNDMKEYESKKAKGLSVSPEAGISYMWEDREIYELGQHKIVDGRDMYISMITTLLRGNELYHTYYMKSKQGLCMPCQYNQRLSGASLIGNVLKIKHEQVQIGIWGDENDQPSENYWFPYATVYSSADGTGWYCMPEVNDRIRLCFPTEKEEDAYVSSAYHEGDAELRQDPKVKFWRNKVGKEIQLTPDHILITNNDGSYIMMDEEGVQIRSEGSVSIQSKTNMIITSTNSSIELNASKRIRLKQGDTEMKLGGNITMNGARIKL